MPGGPGPSLTLLSAALEGQAQLDTLQLLLFLLPPCHSDTLLRLLRFLAEVARHAESSWDPQGRQVRPLLLRAALERSSGCCGCD